LIKPTPERCNRCGNLLFPRHLAVDLDIRGDIDFVCTNCGRAYLWRGDPPVLTVVSPACYQEDEVEQSCRLSLSSSDPDEPQPFEWAPQVERSRKNPRNAWWT